MLVYWIEINLIRKELNWRIELSRYLETACDTLLRWSCRGVSVLSLIWSEMPGLSFSVHHADIVDVLPKGSFIPLFCMSSMYTWMYSPAYSSLILRESRCPWSKYQPYIGNRSSPCFSILHEISPESFL